MEKVKRFYLHLDFAVNFPWEANGFATRSEQFACESPNSECVLELLQSIFLEFYYCYYYYYY